MRVELSSELFPQPPNTIQLYTLANLAFDGIHRLFVEDPDDPRFGEWWEQLPRAHQDEWGLILADAYAVEARNPAERAIKVCVGKSSDWTASPPLVTLSDAVGALTLPFLALLEDWHSDKHFLLSVAPPEQRTFLELMEAKGGLEFVNGGGISNMPKRVRALTDDAGASMRMWVMADSDAMQPGRPSADANRLLAACEERSVPYHQLRRRSIESYLPRRTLEAWANGSGSHRAGRLKKIRALFRLEERQRVHFNMKGGFAGDADRTDDTAGDLYTDVSGPDRATLAEGFGSRVAEIYESNGIPEEHLREDGSWAELSAMVARLARLVR